MAWYDNIDTRGYNNYDGAQEYNPNYGRSFAGVGRFDPRNMIRPDNLTQDMGASTYTAPPVYPGSLYSPHRGFEEIQFDETVQAPEKKGFNFPSMLGMVKGGLEWLGDKFKRPEAKQRFYDEVMQGRSIEPWQTGTYKGNQYGLYQSPSGLKVSSDIIGWGEGYEKNLDSMFGSKSIEEMEQKKIDWAMNRISKGKAISQRLRNALTDRGLIDGSQRGDNNWITRRNQGTYNYGGTKDYGPHRTTRTNVPSHIGPVDRHPGTRPSERPDMSGSPDRGFTNPGKGSYGPHRKDGGRVGLRMGGDPTQWMSEQETITPFQLQQEEGVDMGLQASDDVNTRILENLFEKYLDLGFSPAEAEKLAMEEFESMAQGPQEEIVEEGIASLV